MKLTDDEKSLFESLSGTKSGRTLESYLNRVLAEEMDIEKLNESNLLGKKQFAKYVREYLLEKLQLRQSLSEGSDEYK